MSDAATTLPLGQELSLPEHLGTPVVWEPARPIAKDIECHVRLEIPVAFVSDGMSDWIGAADHYLRSAELNGDNPLQNAELVTLRTQWFTTLPSANSTGVGTVPDPDSNVLSSTGLPQAIHSKRLAP